MAKMAHVVPVMVICIDVEVDDVFGGLQLIL
jgi:hypothetical protein